MAAGLQGWKSWAGAAIQTKGLAAMTRTGAADGEMIEFCMLFEGGDQLATLGMRRRRESRMTESLASAAIDRDGEV